MSFLGKSKYTVAVILSICLLLAGFFYNQSQVNTEEYRKRFSDLIQIQQLTAELIQQVFLVEGNGKHNFDDVAALELKLGLAMQDYQLRAGNDNELSIELNALLRTVGQVKAAYAIYKNSLLYFPRGTQLIKANLENQGHEKLLAAIDDLDRAVILSIVSNSSQTSLNSLKNHIDTVKMLFDEGNTEQHNLHLLLKHAEVLVTNSWILHLLSQTLLENNVTKLVRTELSHLESQMNQEISYSQYVKVWFYVMIVLLTLTVLWGWRKQRLSLETLRKNTKELSLAASVFEETHDGIVITDKDQNIVDVNPAFTRISGYEKEEVVGKKPNMLSSGKQGHEFYEQMWLSLNNDDFWKGEVWNRNKTGELYAELLSISAVKNDQDEVMNYVGIFSDISDIKEQHEKLDLMAHYDVLTQLPNRTLFTDRFYQAIAHSKRTNKLLAICFLDLDDFKPVNDTYGHEMGDNLLVEVAQRIKNCVREVDTVARFGGDEFALLLCDLNNIDECHHTLERIQKSVSQPYKIDGFSLNIGLSSGVTIFPDDDGDADTLLRHADHAMYLAKQEGRNRFHFFNSQQDQEQANWYARINLIVEALDNDEFELYYQPKVNMLTGEVIGVEALIRWNHPEQGVLSPVHFLPEVTGTDIEIEIGEWVIEQALQQIERWTERGINLSISVNIASKHLLTKNFVQSIEEKLAIYPAVSSERLELEILESSVLGDLDEVKSIISSCQRELGIKVALDDFGTGYSSLTHLRNLPVSIIKVDRSFTQNLLNDINDYIIIDSVITLAASFGRTVIAEGIETVEQGLALLLMGCYQAQGYVISKPLPETELVDWLQHYELPQAWTDLDKEMLSQAEKRELLLDLVSDSWRHMYVKKNLVEMSRIGIFD